MQIKIIAKNGDLKKQLNVLRYSIKNESLFSFILIDGNKYYYHLDKGEAIEEVIDQVEKQD